MFGEAEQSLGAGAESVQRYVAVTGINEHDLGYFRVSQMKAPDQCHIVRFISREIDVDDCDLCWKGRGGLQDGVDIRSTAYYVKLGPLP
jgi:hypothetical protein